MAKKKKEEQKEIVEVPFTCTCVGQHLAPAGAGFSGIVTSQRYVKKLGMLLVYFKNGYCCNSQVCTLLPSKE